MTDFVDAATRSKWMASVRRENTGPELQVRRFLHGLGFRYRTNVRTLPGSPDIVLKKYNVCIFVHGCFWHQHIACGYAGLPASRQSYWADKFDSNIRRDFGVAFALNTAGWRIIEFWQCGLRRDAAGSLAWLLEEIVGGEASTASWPVLQMPSQRSG
jgi:DNA mismatch endonuclease (patch repair protein)